MHEVLILKLQPKSSAVIELVAHPSNVKLIIIIIIPVGYKSVKECLINSGLSSAKFNFDCTKSYKIKYTILLENNS